MRVGQGNQPTDNTGVNIMALPIGTRVNCCFGTGTIEGYDIGGYGPGAERRHCVRLDKPENWSISKSDPKALPAFYKKELTEIAA